MLTLARRLAARHDVAVFGLGDASGSRDGFVVEAVPPATTEHPLLPGSVQRTLEFVQPALSGKRGLETFGPDLILSQHQLALLAAYEHGSRGVPHFLFIRDYEFLPDSEGDPDFEPDPLADSSFRRRDEQSVRRTRFGCSKRLTERLLGYIVERSTAVIVNSGHMQEEFTEAWGSASHVVYPFIELDDYRVEEHGDSILHVSPTPEKGIGITLEVAELMPEEEFLIVGHNSWRERVRRRVDSLDNVERTGHRDDVRGFYRESKLLLMPSRWAEPFGRLPVEAGVSGIPTLCSGRGGLSEAVGSDSLVVESNAPEDYVSRIREVDDNYGAYSSLAKRNAESKAAERSLEKFSRVLASYGIGVR